MYYYLYQITRIQPLHRYSSVPQLAMTNLHRVSDLQSKFIPLLSKPRYRISLARRLKCAYQHASKSVALPHRLML